MASKAIIAAKEALVDEVAEKIKKAKSIVLVNHCGLTVEQDTALRVDMRKANVEYKVIKNSILLARFRKMRTHRLRKSIRRTHRRGVLV